ACAGYRVAAGRNALIRKRDYYRRAMWRGVRFGHGAVAVALALMAALIGLAADRAQCVAELERAGLAMLYVYVPYAAVMAVAFAFRMVPSIDVRCLTST